MSLLTRPEIKSFLLQKKGYLKKSPLNVARAIWKVSNKHKSSKNRAELVKELEVIKEVQATLRMAQTVLETEEEQHITDIYEQILEEKNKPKKVLFFDIEVSPNIVLTWRIGSKVNIGHDSIVQERAIICVSWSWEGEDEVHNLSWNNGDDKALVTKFAKIMDSADELVTQNGDAFDIKWVRARCIYHGVPLSPKFNTHDTKKWAKSGFYFNCAKLDYMSKFLGEPGKIETDYQMWKDIVLDNNKAQLKRMVTYCDGDVIELKKVYYKLKPYVPEKKFRYKIK